MVNRGYQNQNPTQATMAEDYYKTLGISRSASDDEIRTAYRDLARKYHPDLNPDDESAKKKFQDATVAFEVLGDKKKREQYDRFGHAFDPSGAGAGGPGGWPGGMGGGGGGVEFDLNDLFGGGAGGAGAGGFADLFKQFGGGAAGGFGGGQGRRTKQPPQRGEDISHEITIPLATAVLGGETSLSLKRAGGKQETINVKIPVGVEDGKKIRLRGQGNPSANGGESGDIMLTVNVAPHPNFRRKGNNLEVDVPVTLAEVAQGAKLDVPTPHGTITMTLKKGTPSGTRLRAKGQGIRPAGKNQGDLYAVIQLVLPESMTDADWDQLAEISDRNPQAVRDDLRW